MTPKTRTARRRPLAAILACAIAWPSTAAFAQDDAAREERRRQAAETEYYEPVPPVVEAPTNAPPSDAVVLFDGTGLDAFEADSDEGGEAPWLVSDGAMSVARGEGGIRTRESYCDVQLHVEWRSPPNTEGHDGQDRGNSGIFFQERYEIQVLDSFENPTYVNGQAGSIYKQHAPLVNASRAPGEWQSYDIVFTAPRFDEAGTMVRSGFMTVLHNGVLVQNHAPIVGTTEYIGPPRQEAHGCAPISLQDHDAGVSFRNIWLRELN